MAGIFDHKSPVGSDGLHNLLAASDNQRITLPEQLQHRITLGDPVLFGDEVVARTRGLLLHITEQVAGARPGASRAVPHELDARSAEQRDAILQAVFADPALLSYAHASALEYAVTCRLAEEADLDPALSPLLQDLASRTDQAVSKLATAVIATQSRFLTDMRRMQMPLRQMPGELLHTALAIGRTYSDNALLADAIDQAVQVSYDEGATRLGLLTILANLDNFPRQRGLRLEDAGVALFVLGLSSVPGMAYEDAVLLLTRQQMLRLALVLRGAGCSSRTVNHNLFLLHEQVAAPAVAGMSRERALELLSQSSPGLAKRVA